MTKYIIELINKNYPSQIYYATYDGWRHISYIDDEDLNLFNSVSYTYEFISLAKDISKDYFRLFGNIEMHLKPIYINNFFQKCKKI